MKLHWFRPLAKRFGALAVGTLLALCGAELTLRFLGVSYPLPYVPDPYCGSRLRPGMVAEFSKEGHAVVSFTSDGRRDRERPLAKPPNTFRIAVLGDSYAEALQVSQDATFWSVLEKKLPECAGLQGREVDVVNFGVSGFGTGQQLEMLRHYVWQYDPDLVLLAFLTGNDISENSKQLAPNDARPYYILQDGELQLDQSFHQHPYYLDALTPFSRRKAALINQFRILQVARQLWAEWRQRQNKPTSKGLETGLDPVYSEPESKAWEEAWVITGKLLLRMRDEVLEHGATLHVVTLSNAIQVHPDPQYRTMVQREWGVSDLFYPDRRVEAFCTDAQIPVTVLAPQLQAYAESNQHFLHGFANTVLGSGHWNETGHTVAGEIIAEALCNQLSSALRRYDPAWTDEGGAGETSR